jgi:hypothetical protein
VWNDLSENDVIYPSDGVEYVLKGSEIFPGCSSSGTHLIPRLFCVHLVRVLSTMVSFLLTGVSRAAAVLRLVKASAAFLVCFTRLHCSVASPFLHNLVIREDFLRCGSISVAHHLELIIGHLPRQIIQFQMGGQAVRVHFFPLFSDTTTPSPFSPGRADRFQHLRVTDRSPTKPPLALPHMSHNKQYPVDGYGDYDAVEDRDDDELGHSYHHRRTASGRPEKAAAAAVSARAATNRARPVELPVEETSPPSSTSSDKPPPPAALLMQQQQQPGRRATSEVPEPSRPGSMLLQLIACGSTTAPSAAGGGGPGKCRAEPRRSCGLVSRLSARGGADADEDEDGVGAGTDLGRRFGRLAAEDKEYFSGSIVEGGGGRGTPLPASSLKRSNSYNEER